MKFKQALKIGIQTKIDETTYALLMVDLDYPWHDHQGINHAGGKRIVFYRSEDNFSLATWYNFPMKNSAVIEAIATIIAEVEDWTPMNEETKDHLLEDHYAVP